MLEDKNYFKKNFDIMKNINSLLNTLYGKEEKTEENKGK